MDDITCLVIVVPHWQPGGLIPSTNPAAAAAAACVAPTPLTTAAVDAAAGRAAAEEQAFGAEAAAESAAEEAADGLAAPGPPSPPVWRQPGVLTWDKLSRVTGCTTRATTAAAAAPAPPCEQADQYQAAADGGDCDASADDQWGDQYGGQAAAGEAAGWDCGWGAVEEQWTSGGWMPAEALEQPAAEPAQGSEGGGGGGGAGGQGGDGWGGDGSSGWGQRGADMWARPGGWVLPSAGEVGWPHHQQPDQDQGAAAWGHQQRDTGDGDSKASMLSEIERLRAVVAGLERQLRECRAGEAAAGKAAAPGCQVGAAADAGAVQLTP